MIALACAEMIIFVCDLGDMIYKNLFLGNSARFDGGENFPKIMAIFASINNDLEMTYLLLGFGASE